MLKFTCIIIFTFCNFLIFGQSKFKANDHYLKESDSAFALYKEKSFQAAALAYDSLFKHTKGRGLTIDKYNAGCAWALSGDQDKSFKYLQKVADDKWSNIAQISGDTDLASLHSNERWGPLLTRIQQNRDKADAKLKKPIIAILDTIYLQDQVNRKNIDTIQKQYGWVSEEMDSLWKQIRYNDSANLVKVKKIINSNGWPGPDEIGEKGVTVVFMKILHADLQTQLKYYPKMSLAVRKHKAEASSLALLEDRILTNQGKKQVYGSQIRQNKQTLKNELYPIKDERNVNKRRAAVGLQPLEEYAGYFGINYELPVQIPVKTSNGLKQ
jgi:hypothetical protein